ncbi:MAG: hypothetical protein RLZZ07_767 [Actinomycetota bacterium]
MTNLLTLEDIKARWNEVLDELLQIDRILWLAFFDARLADFSDGILTLDFLDSEKFATEHNYSTMRKPERIEKVARIAQNILGVQITIVIK